MCIFWVVDVKIEGCFNVGCTMMYMGVGRHNVGSKEAADACNSPTTRM